MFERLTLLVYYAITPIHVGSGRSGGMVDLVVQRDHMGIPMIYASSIKGAFKSTLYRGSCEIYRLFGNDIEFRPYETESMLVFTDAFPLAFPLSTERGHIHYITSPYLLKRVSSIINLYNKDLANKIFNIFLRAKDVIDTAIPLKYSEYIKRVEYICTYDECIKVNVENSLNIEFPTELLKEAPYPAYLISNSLMIVPDNFLVKLVQERMIVNARIAVEYVLKTTRRGALWTEEYVPTGSVFIGALLVKSRKELEKIEEREQREVMEKLHDEISELEKMLNEGIIIALGGKETVGKGFVKIVSLGSTNVAST